MKKLLKAALVIIVTGIGLTSITNNQYTARKPTPPPIVYNDYF